jgi:hypothetical protein
VTQIEASGKKLLISSDVLNCSRKHRLFQRSFM